MDVCNGNNGMALCVWLSCKSERNGRETPNTVEKCVVLEWKSYKATKWSFALLTNRLNAPQGVSSVLGMQNINKLKTFLALQKFSGNEVTSATRWLSTSSSYIFVHLFIYLLALEVGCNPHYISYQQFLFQHMGKPRGKSFHIIQYSTLLNKTTHQKSKSATFLEYKYLNDHDYLFPIPWRVASYLGQISQVVFFHPRPCFNPIYHGLLGALQSTIWTRLWLGPGTCDL